MNVCIIGDSLTSLSLAKNLVNKKINVHIYQKKKIISFSNNRTLGISKNNFDFFEKEILPFKKKIFWEIKKIEIFSEKLKNENLLRFENDQDKLFYMIKNNKLYESLKNKVSKNKFFKKSLIKKNSFYRDLLEKNKFDLIINCDSNNLITNKFFKKKIYKN